MRDSCVHRVAYCYIIVGKRKLPRTRHTFYAVCLRRVGYLDLHDRGGVVRVPRHARAPEVGPLGGARVIDHLARRGSVRLYVVSGGPHVPDGRPNLE